MDAAPKILLIQSLTYGLTTCCIRSLFVPRVRHRSTAADDRYTLTDADQRLEFGPQVARLQYEMTSERWQRATRGRWHPSEPL
jgi:hypothetical protein